LNIPPYYFGTQAEINSDWFSLDVRYINPSAIMVTTHIFEAFPAHYYFNGTQWKRFSPWEYVSSVFPDNTETPFSVEISDSVIKVTEENYCCDKLYNVNSPDRRNYRQVYYLDRQTMKVLKTDRIPRQENIDESKALG
jgi:hypothetical protein